MAKACAHAENRSRILARHWKPQASTEEKLQLVLDSVDNRDFRMNSKDVQNLRELLSRMEFKRDQQDTASVKKRVRVALEWQVHCRSPLGFQSAIIAPAHDHALTARARQLGSIGRLNTRGGWGGRRVPHRRCPCMCNLHSARRLHGNASHRGNEPARRNQTRMAGGYSTSLGA